MREFRLTNKPKKKRGRKPARCRVQDSAPLQVSFSGGRTSGMMLKLMLDSGLKPDAVLFCNTGRERNETLDFVQDVSRHWGVNVVWLEYTRTAEMATYVDELGHGVRVCDYSSARRLGESHIPFQELLKWANVLPNVGNRMCSVQMKVRTMRRYMQNVLGWKEWRTAIGYRADESDRTIDTNAHTPAYVKNLYPLIEAGIGLAEVADFWNRQPFDLQLLSHEGNCDLCFLKSRARILRLMRANARSADWWIAAEADFAAKCYGAGAMFREDRPGYAALLQEAKSPALIKDVDDDIPCGCVSGAWRVDESEADRA